jgi:hypothetical protein
VVVGSPYYYYPRYYSSYWGWYPHYPIGPYPSPYYDRIGSARIQVKPEHTEVHVDGYFVGTADDFDGVFQRLNVELGEHEIQLYLEGYQTVTQKVLLRPGATLKIEHIMQPLGPGDPPESRPTPSGPPRSSDPTRRAPAPAPDRGGDRLQFGSLAIRVQPADAEILIDGEAWETPEGDSRLSVELAEGEHRVEVRREGFRPYATTVRVRRGETLTLNVSLTTGGEAVATRGVQR